MTPFQTVKLAAMSTQRTNDSVRPPLLLQVPNTRFFGWKSLQHLVQAVILFGIHDRLLTRSYGGVKYIVPEVKVGLDPAEDVARVAAVRQAVGPDVRLGVDANGGWSVRTAIQTIQQLYQYDIYFVEQPTPDKDVAWLADVRRHTHLPVMADEIVYTPQDAMAVARAHAADVLSLYVGKGGIAAARKVAAVAEAAGLVCTVGSNLELGIGNAAMIHLAMSTSAIDAENFPCDILSPFFYETDLLQEPLPIRAGEAHPPTGPGLGVELDEEKVGFFRIDRD